MKMVFGGKPIFRSYIISGLILFIVLILSVAVGSVFISPAEIARLFQARLFGNWMTELNQSPSAIILFDLRIPRSLLVALTGAALSGSGASYQGLFRNPLADPFLIGVASGAGLGAIIAMSINFPYSLIGYLAVPVGAFSGAMLTVLVVYQLARVRRTVPTTNLILAGVATSSFTTALTSFLMLNTSDQLHRAVAWLMGGSTMSGWQPVIAVFPYIALGLGVLVTMGHALNVLQFGDDQAQQLGLAVRRTRRIVVVAASLATAAAVSFAGIIGFIGLIVPHIVRLVWGENYRRLIPLSIINGASLLLAADILARIVMAPQEIPLGIITAVIGAPFFLWILRRAKQEYFW